MATAKTTSTPVVGFNHNIKHKDRVFHIQTEDSGLPHAHYITHLFVGGNIMASKKTSYAPIAAAEDMQKQVRGLMEVQHKEMLKNLINGTYDEVAAQFDARSYAPGQLEGDATAYASVDKPLESPEARAKGALGSTAAKSAAAAAAPPPAAKSAAPPPPAAKAAPSAPAKAAPPAAKPPPPRAPAQSGLAPPAGPPPGFKGAVPAPPTPPKVVPPEVVAARQLKEQPKIKDDHPETIFGEDLISEKSLDEVILAYLASVDAKK